MDFLKLQIIIAMLWHVMFLKISKLKIVFRIIHINCVCGFRMMTFTIYLIFTSLSGMIFKPNSIHSVQFMLYVICYFLSRFFFTKNFLHPKFCRIYTLFWWLLNLILSYFTCTTTPGSWYLFTFNCTWCVMNFFLRFFFFTSAATLCVITAS